MDLKKYIREKIARWPYWLISLTMALAAFGAYTCMYAFRKAFAAASFEGLSYLNINFKVWLVIFQVMGYTCSKFYGIKFISAMDSRRRGAVILILIGISWAALLLFALVPAPWSIVFLFVNGFPLGMIWGLVFGYLEGRRSTEFMAAVMSVSLIFASGFVKTVGRSLILSYQVSEIWMPFVVGAIFILPIVFLVGILECLPAPTAEDKLLRVARKPMTAEDRKNFVAQFLPGIALTLVIYVLLTITRDIRDNFEVEIWRELGFTNAAIYTIIDSSIAIVVLIVISLLILIKDNFKAFTIIHLMIISGCLLAGIGAWLFNNHLINPVAWMTISGLGLYLAYIPYNAIFFERMLATYKGKGNVGFIMYIADAAGYLGSIVILFIKELGGGYGIGWTNLFKQGLMGVALIGGIASCFSYWYFYQKRQQQRKTKNNIQILSV